VREAAVVGTTTTATCTLNGTATTETTLDQWTQCEAQVLGETPPANVCVYDTATSTTGTTYTTGDPVEVKLSSTFGWLKLITGRVGNLSSTIGADATMRVEGTLTGTNPFLTNPGTMTC